MEETGILVDAEGNPVGTIANPLYCQVASGDDE